VSAWAPVVVATVAAGVAKITSPREHGHKPAKTDLNGR